MNTSDIRRNLENAGVAWVDGDSTDFFFLPRRTVDPDRREKNFNFVRQSYKQRITLSDFQQKIVQSTSSSPLDETAINVWKGVNANLGFGPLDRRINAQEVISTVKGLDPKNLNITVFDTETLGVNLDGLIVPMDIHFRTFRGVSTGDLKDINKLRNLPQSEKSILVKLNKSTQDKIREIIKKARYGEDLTRDERTVLVHLLRYSDGFETKKFKKTGRIVTKFSDYAGKENEMILDVASLSHLAREGGELERALITRSSIGTPEELVPDLIMDYLEENKDTLLVGANIRSFDIPLLSQWAGDEVADLMGSMSQLDTLEMERIANTDPVKVLSKLGIDVKNFPQSEHGILSMDYLRQALIDLTGEAHTANVDTEHSAVLFAHMLEEMQRVIPIAEKRGKKEFERGAKGQFPSYRLRTDLTINEDPMRPGDTFYVGYGIRGEFADVMDEAGDFVVDEAGNVVRVALDFQMSTKDGKKVSEEWVLNRGFFYDFQGFYEVDGRYIAKFYSPELERISFISAGSIDEMQKKLHGSGLIPWQVGADNEVRMNITRSRLEDLARRRYDRIFQGSGTGWHGVDLVKSVLNDLGLANYKETFPQEYKTVEYYRDLEMLAPRVKSEAEAIKKIIDRAEKEGLSTGSTNLALSKFHKSLVEQLESLSESESPVQVIMPGHDPDRARVYLPDAGSPTLYTSVSTYDHDSFSKGVYGILNRSIEDDSISPLNQRSSRQAAFNRMVDRLFADGVIDEAGYEDLMAMDGQLYYQISHLRSIIIRNQKHMLDQISYQSLNPFDLGKISPKVMDQMIEDSIVFAKTYSENMSNKSALYARVKALLPEGETGSLANSIFQKVSSALEKTHKFDVLPFEISPGKIALSIYDIKQEGAIISSLMNEKTPSVGSILELPMIDEFGDIKYGSLNRIMYTGRLTKEGLVSPQEDILSAVTRALRDLKFIKDPEEIQRTVHRAIRESIERLSGSSRFVTDSSDFQRMLSVSGNWKDLLSRRYVRADDIGLINAVLGTDLKSIDELSFGLRHEYVEKLPGYVKENFGEELQSLSFFGVKDTAVAESLVFAVGDPSDLTPFGRFIHQRRPNILQKENFHPQDYHRISKKIIDSGLSHLVKATPTMTTRKVLEEGFGFYNSRLESPMTSGVMVKAIEMDVFDVYRHIMASSLDEERKKEIVRYLSTSEEQIIMARELSDLFVSQRKKEIRIDMRGGYTLAPRIEDFLARKMAGENVEPIPIQAEEVIARKRVVKHGRPSETVIDFVDDKGYLEDVYIDGDFLVFGVTSDFSDAAGQKHFWGTQKATHTPIMSKDEMKEVFGEVLMVVGKSKESRGEPGDHILGKVQLAIEEGRQNFPELTDKQYRDKIEKDFNELLGEGGKWEEVPGHEGKYTFVPGDKNLLEMYVKDGNIEIGEENPVLDNLIEFMKRQKVSDRHITPIGFAAQQAMKELRRANVSEERRAARWDRKGIERGFGVRFGQNEFLTLSTKFDSQEDYLTSLSSTIKWLQAEIQNDPNIEAYKKFIEDGAKALKILGREDNTALKSLPEVSPSGYSPLPQLYGSSGYTVNEVEKSILNVEQVSSLLLPNEIAIDVTGYGNAAQEKMIIDRVPIIPEFFESDYQGTVYLNDRQKALGRLHRLILEYNEIVLGGEVPYSTRGDVLDDLSAKIETQVKLYIEGFKDFSGKKGHVANLLNAHLPASGYFSAQGLSEPVEFLESMDWKKYSLRETNVAQISRKRAEQLFGRRTEENKMIWDMLEGEGVYSMVMRHPNVHSDSIQVVRLTIGRTLQGEEMRIDPILALLLNADYDGDQLALIAPYSELMMNGPHVLNGGLHNFFDIQEELRGVYERQMSDNSRLIEAMYSQIAEKEDLGEYSDGIFKYLADPENRRLMGHLMRFVDVDGEGNIIAKEVEAARLGKMTTGPLSNIAQKSRMITRAIRDTSQEQMRLIDAFAYTASENMSIQAKSGGVDIAGNIELMRRLNRALPYGSHRVSTDDAIVHAFAEALDPVKTIHRIERFSKEFLAAKTKEEQFKVRLSFARAMLREFEETKGVAGKYWDSPGVNLLFSDSVSSKFGIKGISEGLQEITGDEPLPTETARLIRYIMTEEGEEEFLRLIKHSPFARQGYRPKMPSLSTQLGERMPRSSLRNIFANAGLALGAVAGLYALSSLLRRPDDEDKKEKRINQGIDIKVSAKNRSNIDTGRVATSVSRAVQDEGVQGSLEVSVHQSEDLTTIDRSFISNLFSKALRS